MSTRPESTPVTPLERSHAELRAAVLLATRHIRKLTGGVEDPVLAKLQDVLRDARAVNKSVYRFLISAKRGRRNPQ